MKRFLPFILFLAFATTNAQIINIPADYPTIQQGINAANPGDTVLVADGVYYEQISFWGEPVFVTSLFTVNGDSTHLYNTILDGTGLPFGNASVVKFINYCDTNSVIAGFTIRNGGGCFSGSAVTGGGISLKYAGGKIINNRIIDNYVIGDTLDLQASAWGGGIGTNLYANTNWIVIRDNYISGNVCKTGAINSIGAGIYVSSNIICERNIVANNKSLTTSNAAAEIGGICFDGNFSPSMTGICKSNKILNNIAIAESGEVYGCGFGTINSSIVFSNNEIIGNVAQGLNLVEGCGAAIWECKEGTIITDNYFEGNVSFGNGGALEVISEPDNATLIVIENNTFKNNEAKIGGGIYAKDAQLLVQNNVFFENIATGTYGGGVYLNKSGGELTTYGLFINNSFSENSAFDEGGAIYSNGYRTELLNNILWQNDAPIGTEIAIASGTGYIAYNNIDISKINGDIEILEGNFFEDPKFCATHCLMLATDSPCIDQGVGQYIFPDQDTLAAPLIDILGVIRPIDNVFDVGAYEVDYYVGINEVENNLNVSVYPNPFNGKFFCSYKLEKQSNVAIMIYDLIGRLKASSHKIQVTGDYTLPIDLSNLTNGMYLLKIRINDLESVVKIIKN